MAGKVTLIQGQTKAVKIKILSESSGDDFDLTGATGITAKFAKTDGTVLLKTLAASGITVTAEQCGRLEVSLTEADTAAMLVAEDQGIELVIQNAAGTTIVQLEETLTVKAPIFA